MLDVLRGAAWQAALDSESLPEAVWTPCEAQADEERERAADEVNAELFLRRSVTRAVGVREGSAGPAVDGAVRQIR